MSYQKSIVIILLFSLFFKSNGLQCYQGMQLESPSFKSIGKVSLITCPFESVCFKGIIETNKFFNVNYGCKPYDDLTNEELNNVNDCFTYENSFLMCICDNDGCNEEGN